MKYILEHIYVYSCGEVVKVSISVSNDREALERKAIECNEHQVKFHGDSKDASFYRVRWVKENQ